MSDEEKVVSWFEENYKSLIIGVVIGLMTFGFFGLRAACIVGAEIGTPAQFGRRSVPLLVQPSRFAA